MDVRLKGQAVIKRNMKRYSVLLLGMHENSLDSSEVEEAERRLDDALRQQCVIETSRRGTSDGGEATFAWSLFEWYERRCLLQEKVVNFCFQTGTLAIIGCLMTYMKGHLTLGDPEEMLVAKTAFTCFASATHTTESILKLSEIHGLEWIVPMMGAGSASPVVSRKTASKLLRRSTSEPSVLMRSPRTEQHAQPFSIVTRSSFDWT